MKIRVTKPVSKNASTISGTDQAALPSTDHMFSVGDWIAAMAGVLPRSLISMADRAVVVRAMRSMPAVLTRTVILEARLGVMDASVDISFSIPAMARSHLLNHLISPGTAAKLPEYVPDHVVWRNLAQFARAWCDPESPLFDTINMLWLEFDMPQDNPVPIVFLETVPRVKTAADYSLLRDVALPCLIGQPVPTNTAQLQDQAIESLPEGATIYSFGTVLARGSLKQRMVIDSLGPDRLLPYLHSLGWHSECALLQQMLEVIRDCHGHILLNMDVGTDGSTQVEPLIGIEIILRTYEGKVRFLEHLIANGYCLSDKAQGLADFGGVSTPDTDPDYPQPFREAARILGGTYSSCIQYNLSHLKVVFNGNSTPIAKAYLRFQHDWISRGKATQA